MFSMWKFGILSSSKVCSGDFGTGSKSCNTRQGQHTSDLKQSLKGFRQYTVNSYFLILDCI